MVDKITMEEIKEYVFKLKKRDIRLNDIDISFDNNFIYLYIKISMNNYYKINPRIKIEDIIPKCIEYDAEDIRNIIIKRIKYEINDAYNYAIDNEMEDYYK